MTNAIHFPTMTAKRFFDIAKKSVNAWSDDYASSMGAAIAYYTVFSLAPLLLIVISVAGLVWGREAVEGQVVAQIAGMVGHDAAVGIQDLLRATAQPAKGIVSTLIGLAVLAVGATSVFAELQSALDRIWQMPSAVKKTGLFNTLRARLLSFGLVIGLGFLLIVSLVASAAIAAVGNWVSGFLPAVEILLLAVNTCLSLSLTTALFALIYKFMPQAKLAWRDVLVGAMVTAVLFEVGKLLIGLYIGKSSVTSSFAAAGSIAVLLIWVYYSAQVFLLGAEFTWVYANEHGSHKYAKIEEPIEDLRDPEKIAAKSIDSGFDHLKADSRAHAVDGLARANLDLDMHRAKKAAAAFCIGLMTGLIGRKMGIGQSPKPAKVHVPDHVKTPGRLARMSRLVKPSNVVPLKERA